MSTADVLTVLVSAFALSVAVYGIFERQRAAYAALRVRITELLDGIEGLNVDQQQYAQAHPGLSVHEQQDISGSFAGRRALLTYEALALLDRLTLLQRLPFGAPYRLTAQEHSALAVSLGWMQDFDAARIQWANAIAASTRNTQLAQAAMQSGYALLLFQAGDAALGREHYRNAIAKFPHTELGDWDRFITYVEWCETESAFGAGNEAEPLRAAEELASAPTSWREHAHQLLREVQSHPWQAALGAVGAFRQDGTERPSTPAAPKARLNPHPRFLLGSHAVQSVGTATGPAGKRTTR